MGPRDVSFTATRAARQRRQHDERDQRDREVDDAVEPLGDQ
jgi:hypothetical protein